MSSLKPCAEGYPLSTTTRILKDALRGIAELHDQNIVHTGKFPLLAKSKSLRLSLGDIKADNILVNWEESDNGVTVQEVQIKNLEDAVYIPPGLHMIGKQAGNWMWRSPEAHARSSVNKPPDMFSFALVVSSCQYKLMNSSRR